MQPRLSQNDQVMIELLRQNSAMTIGDLVEEMGVTATAVRQRLNRLMASGLVDRSHEIEGRGRPTHHYNLTDEGRKSLANNLGDLAVALWQEVQKIKDEQTRHQVISGAVERLAEKYEGGIRGATTEERMRSISELFAERQIPVSLEKENGLPVIKVSGCPYPTLAQDNRDICDMEKELLERVIGHPLDRSACQHDGDGCCSFQAGQRHPETKSNLRQEEQQALS
jgi:predicted ArsR family transcriptional regulator